MKLKIISDGTTNGTYVCNAETGDKLEGVQLLNWSASSEDDFAEATIHLWGVACEITADSGMIIGDNIIEQPGFPLIPEEYMDVTSDRVIDISHLLKEMKSE